MKKIKLTKGQYTLVDNEDFERLNAYRWYIMWNKTTKSFYAMRNSKLVNGKYKTIHMAREIMQPPAKMVVDHINHDTLNNQKKNLRICTYSQNLMNRGKTSKNTSGFKGVCFYKVRKKWGAHIMVNQKQTYLGLFATPLLAYKAYCTACIKYHGEFSNIKH